MKHIIKEELRKELNEDFIKGLTNSLKSAKDSVSKFMKNLTVKNVNNLTPNGELDLGKIAHKGYEGIKSTAKNFINGLTGKTAKNNIPSTTATTSNSKNLTSGVKLSKNAQNLIQNPQFNQKLTKVADSLGVRANDLVKVMKVESELNPKARNQIGATGLIQFTRDTARKLGTSTDAIRDMHPVKQLDYVEKYYQPYKGKIRNFYDLYMATFFPAAIGKPDSHILQTKNLSKERVASLNKEIAGGKNYITVGDVKKHLNKRLM